MLVKGALVVVVAIAESLSTSLFSLWVLELGDTLLDSMIISWLVVVGAPVEVMLVVVTVVVVVVLVAFSHFSRV